jgi:hypothetical protein
MCTLWIKKKSTLPNFEYLTDKWVPYRTKRVPCKVKMSTSSHEIAQLHKHFLHTGIPGLIIHLFFLFQIILIPLKGLFDSGKKKDHHLLPLSRCLAKRK